MIAHWGDTATDEEARALDRQMWDFATRKEADGTVISQAPGPPLTPPACLRSKR